MSRADYVEETTTSIAGTLGNGAVTMTAIASTPRFSTVFGTNARVVDYVIEDTVTKKFEQGIGSVAANVLTRTTPRVTWDGTTWDDTTPAALQFGATPTSGNVKIRMAATASDFYPALPALQKTVGSDEWLGYQIPQQIIWGSAVGSPPTTTVDREYYMPYLSLIKGSFDGFAIDINTVGTTGIKMALYEVGADGLPGACITRSNTIANTSTGIRTDIVPATWGTNAGPLRLAPGWYYIGFICGDSTCRVAHWPGQNAGVITQNTPLGKGLYGAIASIRRDGGSYATGMPSGVPGGGYTVQLYEAWRVAMRFNN